MHLHLIPGPDGLTEFRHESTTGHPANWNSHFSDVAIASIEDVFGLITDQFHRLCELHGIDDYGNHKGGQKCLTKLRKQQEKAERPNDIPSYVWENLGLYLGTGDQSRAAFVANGYHIEFDYETDGYSVDPEMATLTIGGRNPRDQARNLSQAIHSQGTQGGIYGETQDDWLHTWVNRPAYYVGGASLQIAGGAGETALGYSMTLTSVGAANGSLGLATPASFIVGGGGVLLAAHGTGNVGAGIYNLFNWEDPVDPLLEKGIKDLTGQDQFADDLASAIDGAAAFTAVAQFAKLIAKGGNKALKCVSTIGDDVAKNPPTIAPKKVKVTSWAEAGHTSDLNSGRWVQVGGPTVWNYLKTGLWGGKFSVSKSFPWITWRTFRSQTTSATLSMRHGWFGQKN